MPGLYLPSDLKSGAGVTSADFCVYEDVRCGSCEPRRGLLLPAVREQADKMGRYYGLQTQVLAHADVRVTARLQDEVLHMIREALSNVRRHTCGRCVTISVHASARQLLMEVVNDHPGIAGIVRDFYPHSIGERAEDLGGQVRVEQRNGCHTALVIELPL